MTNFRMTYMFLEASIMFAAYTLDIFMVIGWLTSAIRTNPMLHCEFCGIKTLLEVFLGICCARVDLLRGTCDPTN